MSLTFKAIADAVLNEISFPAQDQYFGSSSTQELTMSALANRSVKVLTQDGLSMLRKEGSITLTSATEYDLPSDLRYIVPDTMQAQDQERFVKFPTSTEEWWYLKSRTGPNGIRYKVRLYDGSLQVEDPQAGIVLIFEYLTNNVITSTGSPAPDKERFTKDTDTWLLDDDLIIMDLKWRYLQAKGLDFQVSLSEFREYQRTHRGKEAGSRTLNMGQSDYDYMPSAHYDLYQ